MAQQLITAATLQAQVAPGWTIPDIIPDHSFSVLYGKPKSGKSFLALHWALTLAHQGYPVLYLAGEGLGGYGRRLKAWHSKHGKVLDHEVPLLFSPNGINLGLGDNVTKIIQAVKHHDLMKELVDEGEFVAEFVKPMGLIVIDTLSRSIPGGDENDAKSMTVAIEQIDRLRNETQAALLVVHHTTKDSADDENARERGSSTLRGAADVMVHVSKKHGTVSINAARDFEDGQSWGYVVEPVLESAVATLSEPKDEGDALGDAQQAVLAALQQCTNPYKIKELTKMSLQHINYVLGRLMEKGLVTKPTRGTYVLSDPKP